MEFAGRDWIVKDSAGRTTGPGDNVFAADNAWVDAAGHLHLRVGRRSGRWTCAEVLTAAPTGPGRHEFRTVGRLDRLDPHAVLGLFLYDHAVHYEVDVEFARWGHPDGPAGSFALYPGRDHDPLADQFDVALSGPETTHTIEVTPDAVSFASRHGDGMLIRQSRMSAAGLPRDATPHTHLNLWLFRAVPPAAETEVVVTDYRFDPRGRRASHFGAVSRPTW